jgi:hypothetical protein
MTPGDALQRQPVQPGPPEPTCRCIDWFAEGESKVVVVGGVRIVVRFIGRKGRRGRCSRTRGAQLDNHRLTSCYNHLLPMK